MVLLGGGGSETGSIAFLAALLEVAPKKWSFDPTLFLEIFRPNFMGTLHCFSGRLAGKTYSVPVLTPLCFRSPGRAAKGKNKWR